MGIVPGSLCSYNAGSVGGLVCNSPKCGGLVLLVVDAVKEGAEDGGQ